ncbi:MAG: DUF6541 family protein [Scrofimicrobium sp.]
MTLQWVPDWLALLPLVAAMVLCWFGASYFWLRLARIPAVVALAVAPAVTTTLIWLLSIFWQAAGWFWSGARVLPVIAFIGLTGAALYVWFWRTGRMSTPASDKARLRFLPGVAAISIACLIGWILAAIPMMVAAPSINPVQQWDPSFHMNGVWSITQEGIASPGEGLASNYGGAASREYPIGWHAFTSLFATGPTTVQVSNASSLALMALWVIAIAALTRFLFPARITALAAPIIAGIPPSMPADALTAYQQTPNAMSVALLPGIAAIAVLAGRQLVALFEGRASRWRDLLPTLLIALVALYGGIQAHPVVAFNLLFFLAPAAIAGAVGLILWATRSHDLRTIFIVVLAVISAVVVVVVVNLTPELESLRNYNRKGIGIETALSQVFVPTPPFPSNVGVPVTSAILTALAAAGSVWIVLAKYTDKKWTNWKGAVPPIVWPIWSWGLYLALVFFAYGPNWSIRKWIVGPWFSDGRRIMEAMSVPLVMLAAVGVQWTVLGLVHLWNKTTGRKAANSDSVIGGILALVLLVGSLGGGLDGRIAAAKSVMDPTRLGKPGMATQGVLDMMRELPELLPEDAIVLGDPQAGAMYSQMIGQRRAYFPQLTLMNQNKEAQEILLQGFNEIATNPAVCEVVKSEGITHFYQHPDGYYYSRLRGDRAPGLYNVDTSEGFELVAEGDQARLYRITACD